MSRITVLVYFGLLQYGFRTIYRYSLKIPHNVGLPTLNVSFTLVPRKSRQCEDAVNIKV